jgi:hypothetical protein
VPLIVAFPSDTRGSSPSIAEISDVFPSPVPPIIATKLPTGISKLIFDNVVFSACELNTHFYTSNIKIIK